MNAGQSVRFQVPDDQINRWFAARAELWPEGLLDFGGLIDPWVSFDGDELHAAATVQRGALRGVIVLAGRVEVRDDVVLVHCERARLGTLPIPLAWFSGALAQVRSANSAIVGWDDARTLTLRNQWIWPNGKRNCRLREFRLSNGLADVVLEPLPSRSR